MAGTVPGVTVFIAGTFRAIPGAATTETGSVTPRTYGVVNRRCVAVGASMTGLAREAILSRGPVTSAGKDFVEAAARVVSEKNEG